MHTLTMCIAWMALGLSVSALRKLKHARWCRELAGSSRRKVGIQRSAVCLITVLSSDLTYKVQQLLVHHEIQRQAAAVLDVRFVMTR